MDRLPQDRRFGYSREALRLQKQFAQFQKRESVAKRAYEDHILTHGDYPLDNCDGCQQLYTELSAATKEKEAAKTAFDQAVKV